MNKTTQKEVSINPWNKFTAARYYYVTVNFLPQIVCENLGSVAITEIFPVSLTAKAMKWQVRSHSYPIEYVKPIKNFTMPRTNACILENGFPIVR